MCESDASPQLFAVHPIQGVRNRPPILNRRVSRLLLCGSPTTLQVAGGEPVGNTGGLPGFRVFEQHWKNLRCRVRYCETLTGRVRRGRLVRRLVRHQLRAGHAQRIRSEIRRVGKPIRSHPDFHGLPVVRRASPVRTPGVSTGRNQTDAGGQLPVVANLNVGVEKNTGGFAVSSSLNTPDGIVGFTHNTDRSDT